ncbi:hypothetical protein [Oleiharenicola lentus]|uniref:hypothetical protein n=1 Tax=Oleiharenicola lentus TaxID=2508720 RepID=UPI003F665A89
MNLRNFSGRMWIGVICVSATVAAHAWDYEGHRMVHQLALKALPADFPAFVHEPANAERVAFLAGEPDRWRNVNDGPLKQSGGSWSDHFCDVEYLSFAGIDPEKVTSFRYDFIVQFSAGRAANEKKFPVIDPAKNLDHTAEWPGFAPWAITEYYGKLKSGFAYLKTFEELGTPEEIANAKANVLYIMGIIGHYVGDLAQPLHTTYHHNGWVGDNPHGYTTWNRFHSWIDGGFVAAAGINLDLLSPHVKPARAIALKTQPDARDPMFVSVMSYLIEQNKFVEPLYALDKKGALRAEVAKTSVEGQEFMKARLLAGSDMLANVWLTAWKNAGPDTYLRTQLLKRQAAALEQKP